MYLFLSLFNQVHLGKAHLFSTHYSFTYSLILLILSNTVMYGCVFENCMWFANLETYFTAGFGCILWHQTLQGPVQALTMKVMFTCCYAIMLPLTICSHRLCMLLLLAKHLVVFLFIKGVSCSLINGIVDVDVHCLWYC